MHSAVCFTCYTYKEHINSAANAVMVQGVKLRSVYVRTLEQRKLEHASGTSVNEQKHQVFSSTGREGVCHHKAQQDVRNFKVEQPAVQGLAVLLFRCFLFFFSFLSRSTGALCSGQQSHHLGGLYFLEPTGCSH